MLKVMRGAALVLCAALAGVAWAAPDARSVVEQTTDQLLADLKAHKSDYKSNPSDFYAALERILGPVVDTDGMAKGVMTVRYSRSATPAQMSQFEQVFKRSLMQFYGNALLEYENQTIRVLPNVQGDSERASVNMEIIGGKGEVYPLSYTMISHEGGWRMRNVIINGINVGKLFRDQFAESARKNSNDLDKTIAGWLDTVAKAKSAQNQ